MKKLGLLVMPLMVVSLLASCNEGDKPTPEEYTLSITLDNCKIGEESETYTKKYIKGATIDDITVTPDETCFFKESSISIDYKDYWSEGEDGSWVLSNLVMDSDHTINIKGLHNYHVSVDKCEHLSFTTVNDEPLDNVLATEGEYFIFKMTATVGSIGEGYKLPTQLSIFVGDSTVELERSCYIINEITPQYDATVTIKSENVTGDIKISGKGIQQGFYEVNVKYCFGVGTDIEDFPYFYTNQDGVVTFIQEGTYELPAEENIIVKFDNEDWINPSDTSEWCTYNTDTHKLTLKKDKAISNVMIRARSPEYQILAELGWDKISDYSSAGYAPYLFYVGDEKTVKVNELDHKVRIIGFNHDDLVGGGKAGITFEFANVITDSDESVVTYWNDKEGNESTNYDFPDSTLNDFLNKNNDCIFNKLPNELQGAIKEVKKPIALDESYEVKDDFLTKLFPLSFREMTEDSSEYAKEEGSTYTFYQGSGDTGENRIKKKVNGTNGEYYWLRSPYTDYRYYAWRIYDGGSLYSSSVYSYEDAIAPAFCI